MARPISWLIRSESIRRTVAGSARSHYSRAEIQSLFEVQTRTAQNLLNCLPSTRVGSTLLVPREDLLSFLDLVIDADDPADTVAQLQKAERPNRIRTSLRSFNKTETVTGFDSVPANLHLSTGEVRITFTTLEDLAHALFCTADLLQNDLDGFARRYEPPLPPGTPEEDRQRDAEKHDADYIKNWKPGML